MRVMGMVGAQGAGKLIAPYLIAKLSAHEDTGIGKGQQIAIHRGSIKAGTGHSFGQLRVADRCFDSDHFSKKREPLISHAQTLRREQIAEFFIASGSGLHGIEILARSKPRGNLYRRESGFSSLERPLTCWEVPLRSIPPETPASGAP